MYVGTIPIHITFQRTALEQMWYKTLKGCFVGGCGRWHCVFTFSPSSEESQVCLCTEGHKVKIQVVENKMWTVT
jgi:hypothetical protein